MTGRWIALGCAMLMTTDARSEPPVVRGLYEIGYRMEMPHLERYALPRSVQMCIDDAPFPVMSGNGAFSDCAMEDVRRDAALLRYTLVCQGVSGARAFVTYTLGESEFSGQALVKLGAKNMTLTEVQVGRRVGPCPAERSAQN